MILVGLSLFLLTACGTTVPATEEGAQQSSVAAPVQQQVPVVDESSSESSVSSVDEAEVPAVDAAASSVAAE